MTSKTGKLANTYEIYHIATSLCRRCNWKCRVIYLGSPYHPR